MCRIELCSQIGVKISSYGDRKFIKINPLNCPMGQFIRREDMSHTMIFPDLKKFQSIIFKDSYYNTRSHILIFVLVIIQFTWKTYRFGPGNASALVSRERWARPARPIFLELRPAQIIYRNRSK